MDQFPMISTLAAAALVIPGAVTVQAADIFTCGALEYAMHDGKVERVCSAPVTTHWTKLGERFSALVNYLDEPDGRPCGGAVGRIFHSARGRVAEPGRAHQCPGFKHPA